MADLKTGVEAMATATKGQETTAQEATEATVETARNLTDQTGQALTAGTTTVAQDRREGQKAIGKREGRKEEQKAIGLLTPTVGQIGPGLISTIRTTGLSGQKAVKKDRDTTTTVPQDHHIIEMAGATVGKATGQEVILARGQPMALGQTLATIRPTHVGHLCLRKAQEVQRSEANHLQTMLYAAPSRK